MELKLNKRDFLEHLMQLCTLNEKTRCLVLIEINNSTHVASFLQGFEAEQEVANQVEQLILTHISRHQKVVLGKLGNNQFGLVLPNTIEETERIATDLADAIDQSYIQIQEQRYYPKLYLGISPLTPEYTEFQFAFAAAREALHQASITGGSTVKILTPNAPKLIQYRNSLTLLPIIRREGLLNKHFVLFAQPIVPLNPDSTEKKCEILLRYKDADGNFNAPYPYLLAANMFHVTRDIDVYVITQFCHFMQTNTDTETVYSINISGNTVRYAQFLQVISTLFQQYNIDTRRVCFEITEDIASQDIDDAQILMHALKQQLGCQLSLDDIGIGSSNFETLPKFDVDYMKIDGSYIQDLLTNPYSEMVVAFISQAAKLEGKKTVAEYVECPEQLDKLTAMGIDYGQGYLLGKPKLLFDPSS